MRDECNILGFADRDARLWREERADGAVWVRSGTHKTPIRISQISRDRFPYLDTLKLQEKFLRSQPLFLPHGSADDLRSLEIHLETTRPGTTTLIFVETPSNPLLRVADLPALRRLADAHSALLIIDDTIGNFLNVSTLPYADMLVSSLTKAVSGRGDVLAGSLVVNHTRRAALELATRLRAVFAGCSTTLYERDLAVLVKNSAEFPARNAALGPLTHALCARLAGHPKGE